MKQVEEPFPPSVPLVPFTGILLIQSIYWRVLSEMKDNKLTIVSTPPSKGDRDKAPTAPTNTHSVQFPLLENKSHLLYKVVQIKWDFVQCKAQYLAHGKYLANSSNCYCYVLYYLVMPSYAKHSQKWQIAHLHCCLEVQSLQVTSSKAS